MFYLLHFLVLFSIYLVTLGCFSFLFHSLYFYFISYFMCLSSCFSSSFFCSVSLHIFILFPMFDAFFLFSFYLFCCFSYLYIFAFSIFYFSIYFNFLWPWSSDIVMIFKLIFSIYYSHCSDSVPWYICIHSTFTMYSLDVQWCIMHCSNNIFEMFHGVLSFPLKYSCFVNDAFCCVPVAQVHVP